MARSRTGRIALGATIALTVPLVVACNQLIGLSDFDKGQCAGARCPDEGGAFDVQVDTNSPDVRTDAPVDGNVKGADPVSWAKWKMPNYGDGAAPTPTAQSLALNGDIVTDNVTGLVWRSKTLPNQTTALEANAECAKLADGPWRAPKRIEVVTLLDYTKTGQPYLDGSKFTNIINDVVWTTSEVRPFDPNNPQQPYWVVSFATGKVETLQANAKANVLCVKAAGK